MGEERKEEEKIGRKSDIIFITYSSHFELASLHLCVFQGRRGKLTRIG